VPVGSAAIWLIPGIEGRSLLGPLVAAPAESLASISWLITPISN
jgi:hypothetical protein